MKGVGSLNAIGTGNSKGVVGDAGRMRLLKRALMLNITFTQKTMRMKTRMKKSVTVKQQIQMAMLKPKVLRSRVKKSLGVM